VYRSLEAFHAWSSGKRSLAKLNSGFPIVFEYGDFREEPADKFEAFLVIALPRVIPCHSSSRSISTYAAPETKDP
jgi:hypothetical protein